MPVGLISAPGRRDRWSHLAFGILGDPNTCLFRVSAGTSHSSRRLFFLRFLRTFDQALSDTQTGIAVGMIAHLALWAETERGSRGVAFHRLSLVVANDSGVTAMAFSARIARIHPARDDAACIPRLILAVPEDAALHPVGAFRIASAAIRALFWAQVAQVLKHEETGLLLPRELDNARADQVRDLFIDVADLPP